MNIPIFYVFKELSFLVKVYHEYSNPLYTLTYRGSCIRIQVHPLSSFADTDFIELVTAFSNKGERIKAQAIQYLSFI